MKRRPRHVPAALGTWCLLAVLLGLQVVSGLGVSVLATGKKTFSRGSEDSQGKVLASHKNASS